jgi:hypothetical protein
MVRRYLGKFIVTAVHWGSIPFALLTTSLNFEQTALAEGEEILRGARSAFSEGDIEKASKSLERGMPRMTGIAQEEGKKLLGVCYFLLGKRKAAENMFKQVLAKTPTSKLNPKDILDPDIAELFEKIRKRQVSGSVASSPPRQRYAPPSSSGGPRAPEVPESRGGSNRGSFTGLLVNSNTHVTVFSNRLFVGTGGQDIALDPGKHELTVSAPGYEPASKVVSLKKGERLTLTVNLRKVGGEDEEAERRPSRRAPPPAAKRGMDYNSELPAPKKSGRSLADEFYSEPVEQPPAPPPQQAYTQPPPQQYAQPPPQQYAQPPPQQYAQPPPQQYAQPPPQQYAQPPPLQYAQPPPQRTYQPQQPVYAAPRPEPQPAPNIYGTDESYGRVKKKGKVERSAFLACLPFGVGQFQNDQPGKGALFLGAQVGGIGWAYYNYYLEQDFVNKNATAESQEPTAEPDPEIEAYNQQVLAYRSGLQTSQYIGWGIFVGAWAIGVIDAFINIDRVTPVKGRGRRNAEVEIPDTLSMDEKLALAISEKPYSPDWKFRPFAKTDGREAGFKISVNF